MMIFLNRNDSALTFVIALIIVLILYTPLFFQEVRSEQTKVLISGTKACTYLKMEEGWKFLYCHELGLPKVVSSLD